MRSLLVITFFVGVVWGELSFDYTCDRNTTYQQPSSGSCKGYWDCNHGILKFSKCSYLYSFDSEKLKCVWNPFRSNSVPCCKSDGLKVNAGWCKNGRYFKAPVKGLCTSYYECTNGTLDLKNCNWPTQFNPQEQECQLPMLNTFSCGGSDVDPPVTTLGPDSGLSTTPTPDEGTTKSSGHDVRPQCTKGRNFVAVDHGDCNKYLSCVDGVLTSKNCGYLYYFDATRLECRIWFRVDCTPSSKSPNEPVTTLRPKTTPHPPKDDSRPVCLSTNYFTAVYKDDCKKYYLCSKGNLIVKECSFMQQFNPLNHECQYSLPYYSDCSEKPGSHVCKQGYFYKASYPGNENSYYDCSNGTLSVKNCGTLRTFIASTETCVYSLFGYELNKKISEPVDEWISMAPQLSSSSPIRQTADLEQTSYTNQEIITTLTKSNENVITNNLKCNKYFYFNFTYQGDCHKYHSCVNGSVKTFECPFGHKFDNWTRTCTVMTQCDLSTCYSKGPLCYPGITYLIPFSTDCKKYTECLDGVWTTKSCSLLHEFNPYTQKCEFHLFSKSNCFTSMNCSKNFFELTLNKKELVKAEKVVDVTNWKASGWPKCDPGQNFKTAFQYDCGKYLRCNNGNVTVESCSMFDKFDPKTRECRFNSPWDPVVCGTTPGKPVCEPGQRFQNVFPYDCAKYYDCDNGNLTVKKCSMFDKFDPKILACRFKWDFFNPINCGSPPGEPTCVKGKNFNSIYPDDCSIYYKCSDGVVSQEKCVLWKLFDPGSLQCRWNFPYIDSVNCSAVPGSELVGKIKVRDTTKVQNGGNNSSKTNSNAEVAGPSCSVGQNFKTVYPNDCKKYFDCVNGIENVEKCFWLRKFNPASYECRWDLPFYRVNCSASPGSDLPVYPTNVRDGCIPGKSFKSVDKSDCDSYYACSDGKLSYESCGMMEKFDPVSLKCKVDLPLYRVNCSALPGQPDCPKTGILLKPYPGNCEKYYECNNSTLRVVTCGLMQKFDHETLSCRYEWFPIKCGDF